MAQDFSCKREIKPSPKYSAPARPGLRGGLSHAARGNTVQICSTSPVFSVLVQLLGTYGKINVLSY